MAVYVGIIMGSKIDFPEKFGRLVTPTFSTGIVPVWIYYGDSPLSFSGRSIWWSRNKGCDCSTKIAFLNQADLHCEYFILYYTFQDYIYSWFQNFFCFDPNFSFDPSFDELIKFESLLKNVVFTILKSIRDNWTLIFFSQNKSKASDWPTNQERPFKSGTIFPSKAYSSLSLEDREYFYSFY